MIVLIPSYEPDHKLVRLVRALRLTARRPRVLVVNDGSDPRFDSVFDEARASGAMVIEHRPNRGKGYALKQGFDYLAAHYPDQDVVCADSDGQHTPADILAVAGAVELNEEAIILGARGFTGEVPLRSRFGNSATRVALRLTSRLRLQDTQTGLRGYPAELLPWLGTIPGERFEYELNVLLEAKRCRVPIAEIPIETVYIDENASSHFRPFVDSVRVYLPLLKFGMSSLAAAAIDLVLVLGLVGITGNLALAVVVARSCSATFNFTLNRWFVFDPAGRTPLRTAITGYSIVAVGVLVANYLVLHLLYERLGIALVMAKLATDLGLFLTSFVLQKHFVFVVGKGADRTVGHKSASVVVPRSNW